MADANATPTPATKPAKSIKVGDTVRLHTPWPGRHHLAKIKKVCSGRDGECLLDLKVGEGDGAFEVNGCPHDPAGGKGDHWSLIPDDSAAQ